MKKTAKKTTKKTKVEFDDILDTPTNQVTNFGVPAHIAAKLEENQEAEPDWTEGSESNQDEPMTESMVNPQETSEKPVKTPPEPGIAEPFDFAYAQKVVYDLWQGIRFVYKRAKRKVSFAPEDIGDLTRRTDKAVELIELLKREAEKQGRE